MADKQAFVYIVDMGKSMGNANGEGRPTAHETDLEYGMRYVWDKITTTMIADRKTFTVGVIGLRTDETSNPMGDDEGYQHISILQPLGPMQMPQLKKLQETIHVSKTESGDAISAIIIAIEMIEMFTKKLKYFRKIVLMTNGRGAIDSDDIDEIAKKLNEENIELVVVGVDFDDLDYGFKEEDKDLVKASNEALLKSLTAQCDKSTFGTVAEAVHDISVPRPKNTRPYKSYEGPLSLGLREKYESSALCIDVERYFRTKVATAPSASSFVVRTGGESTQSSHTVPNDEDTVMGGTGVGPMEAVKNARIYKVKDESAVGGLRDVEREDLARGYEYGRTAVHIAESDQNVTKLDTIKSFAVIGFIPVEKYEPYFNIGETGIIVAQKLNDKARMALSSFIHALHELDSYAVARLVLKDGKDPQLLLLAPSIEPDLESLIDIPLPFAEDIRLYRFPPLDRVITVSGNVLNKHRNLPTDELVNAMDSYVDSMDISKFGLDEEGAPIEFMSIEDSYSPVLHRIHQSVKRRAVRRDEPVQPPSEILIQYSKPPDDLLEFSHDQLKCVIAAADIKKVPPKAKGRRAREMVTPLSGLNVDKLLDKKTVTVENAIPDFKQIISSAEDTSDFEKAAAGMASVIRTLVKDSMANINYSQAIANLAIMKEQLVQVEEPQLYNHFMKDFKRQLLNDELGGKRKDFFWEIKKARLGLIDQNKSDASDVTEEMPLSSTQ